jgi:hypothetical protein
VVLIGSNEIPVTVGRVIVGTSTSPVLSGAWLIPTVEGAGATSSVIMPAAPVLSFEVAEMDVLRGW